MNHEKSRSGLGVCLKWACVGVAALGVAGTAAAADTWLIQAEQAYQALPESQQQDYADWSVRPVEQAGGGAVLQGALGDRLQPSPPLTLHLAEAGSYTLWVRYQRPADDASSAFHVLVRDPAGEGMALGRMDFVPRLPTARPYQSNQPAARTGTEAGDFVWEKLDFVAERPMAATLSFGGLIPSGKRAPRVIDAVVLTRDAGFDPRQQAWQTLPGFGEQQAAAAAAVPSAPAGMQPSPGQPTHSSFFSGIEDPAKQFSLGVSYNAAIYYDHPGVVRMGFNRISGGSLEHGLRSTFSANVFETLDAQTARQYPSPEGRFVNADGQVGRTWSLSFPPLRETLLERTRARIESHIDNPAIEGWRIVGESGGMMDYSDYAKAAFRQWLADRYQSIEQVNALWGTAFADFDSVEPPVSPEQNKAGWFAYRAFNGEVFARAVAQQVQVLRELDPSGRKLLGQSSNLDLLAARFTALRPKDWEQFIEIALADEPAVGWDGYCADDFMGAEVELLDSLAGHRHVMNREWNPHATDWRIAGRTLWGMIGKGLRGVHCFQLQEGTHHNSYPKWALLNHDFSPKPKLGAMSDIAHEVHRLEPLVMSSQRVEPVKPVALYYSRLDLSLAKPLASAWGEPVNTPYHVYRTLRAAGYDVRWITPRQIEAGQLDQVSAVFLVGAEHVPAAAARTLADWVAGGGVVVGDQWPGALDEYGRPQATLAEVFGIQAASTQPRSQGGELALQESTQGYGEVTIAAIEGNDIPSTVGEIWQQWDATHPVAQTLGHYMLSGYGLTRVQCVSGEVVGMTFGGRPGVVINNHGKGQAMYLAMMLGSIYEGSATRFESDTTHSGMAYHRLLDAFLSYSGVERLSQVDLPERLAAKVRVERPLVDPVGNAIVALTSLNDQALGSFELSLAWADLAEPRQVLLATNGNRDLTPVTFKRQGDRLVVQVGGFDTHATLLMVVESQPLVSLRVTGADRGPAGLVSMQAGDVIDVQATVWNLGDQVLPAGQVNLWSPDGWWQDQLEQTVSAIEPGQQAVVQFQVQAPAVAGAIRLRPIVARYAAGDVVSTPATEVIWWGQGAAGPLAAATTR